MTGAAQVSSLLCVQAAASQGKADEMFPLVRARFSLTVSQTADRGPAHSGARRGRHKSDEAQNVSAELTKAAAARAAEPGYRL